LYEILVSYDIFKNPFNKISFLINTFDNIFIPSSLFDEKYKNYYCQYYHPIESSFIEICADSLLSLNMVNLYYLNKNLKEVINKMFNKADIFHSSTTLITGLFSMFKNNINEYTAFINLGVNYFNLIVIGQEGLIFFNSFKYKNPDDVLYHTLFVFEQFKLKQQTTPLYLAGEIDTNSEFYELLYKYIGKLHLLERNKEFDYSYVLDTVKEHLYFSAFNKELCA
ncbi:MAG TPA: DUF3822 family protein, partial [Bacteroidales bacterium]|nr:DUF3822 family protein [Bacteroidales bacterium]